ncbi:MAG TPA: hypothetical protein VKV20_12905 [Ktedonobacteraceae bacterium]|jgi:hypothetical protein|nr:hypothetical protein [Ktedonobacteraceae bacterium]
MQVLPFLVALLLGMAALAFVLYPLYRENLVRAWPGHGEESASPNGMPQNGTHGIVSSSIVNAAEREQMAKAALQEVELDYQLGNLEEADYRSWKERYTRRAILAMKSRQNSEQELDALIEAQLRRMKEGKVVEEHDEE